MKNITLLIVFFFAGKLFAQQQEGYYITNDGQRTDGLFKTGDFYNQSALEFKTADQADFSKLDTGNVIEYGISDEFMFKKFDIDGQALFLNTIIKGDATLYSHVSTEGITYYYTTGNSTVPEKLQHIKTRSSARRNPENNIFWQQLQNNVNCQAMVADDFNRLQYTEGDLRDVFTKHNLCKGASQTFYQNSTAKITRFHIALFAGLYNTDFNIDNLNPAFAEDKTLSFGLGVEVAYRFMGDNFEVFAKAEFENFSASIKKDFPQGGGDILTRYYDINTTVANVFIGPRYNLKLNKNNWIFVDAAFGLSVPFGDLREYEVLKQGGNYTNIPGEKNDLDTAVCGNFGLGYLYKNKYGIVFRYETNREFFNSTNTGYTAQINRFGFNLKYIFN